MAASSPTTLRLTRDQIAATMALSREGKPDHEVTRQVERLISMVNTMWTAFPLTDVVENDTNVDATGVLLSVAITTPGTYNIALNWTMTTAGAGTWQLAKENTVVFPAINYSAAGVETAGAFAFAVPSAALYLFSGDPLGVYAFTGTINVTTIGTLGMRFTKTGGTTVTIHAGARLKAEQIA
jgi:hypothetical protein